MATQALVALVCMVAMLTSGAFAVGFQGCNRCPRTNLVSAYCNSDFVLRVRIQSETMWLPSVYRSAPRDERELFTEYRYNFVIEKNFKPTSTGRLARHQSLRNLLITARDGDSNTCAIRLTVGKTYIVMGYFRMSPYDHDTRSAYVVKDCDGVYIDQDTLPATFQNVYKIEWARGEC